MLNAQFSIFKYVSSIEFQMYKSATQRKFNQGNEAWNKISIFIIN